MKRFVDNLGNLVFRLWVVYYEFWFTTKKIRPGPE